MIWALMILENEVTEKHFEIIEYDDYQKPKKIRPLDDYGFNKKFVDPHSMYTNEKFNNNGEMPVIFSDLSNSESEKDQDIDDLINDGWMPLE